MILVIYYAQQWAYSVALSQLSLQFTITSTASAWGSQQVIPVPAAHQKPQRLQVGGTNQARHLHQPGWGLLPQERHQLLTTGAPAEATQRLQHRQIGLHRPVVLHALPAPDPRGTIVAKLHHKGLHQGGLAQTHFTRDKDYLADTTARSGEPGVETCQFHLSPDRWDSTAHAGRQTTRGWSSHIRWAMLSLLNVSHKAVALAVQRTQVARCPPPLP